MSELIFEGLPLFVSRFVIKYHYYYAILLLFIGRSLVGDCMVIIDIELPKPVTELLKRDPILRRVVENVAGKAVRDILIEILALDQLLSDSKLKEEDVAELDKIVKAEAWKKLKSHVIGNRHE